MALKRAVTAGEEVVVEMPNGRRATVIVREDAPAGATSVKVTFSDGAEYNAPLWNGTTGWKLFTASGKTRIDG